MVHACASLWCRSMEGCRADTNSWTWREPSLDTPWNISSLTQVPNTSHSQAGNPAHSIWSRSRRTWWWVTLLSHVDHATWSWRSHLFMGKVHAMMWLVKVHDRRWINAKKNLLAISLYGVVRQLIKQIHNHVLNQRSLANIKRVNRRRGRYTWAEILKKVYIKMVNLCHRFR